VQKPTQKILFFNLAALSFFLPSVAVAEIADTQCSDCHIASNDHQEVPAGPPWQMDCISCHALGSTERIVTLPGGALVPQVYHYDPTGDLAGGNFRYIMENIGLGPTGSRKGHDVIDLDPGVFYFPPGFKHEDNPTYFRELTCAGVNGCHGVRNQLQLGPGGIVIPRVGMAAMEGVHHANEDGPLKVADTVANSYRFLMGVKGLEHTYAPDRWQNVTPAIHNEYYGEPPRPGDYDLCATCHVISTRATLDSYITAPRKSMSGFCATCHSNFHADSAGVMTFFRHPSDFVIPNEGEYAEYLFYELTAPVARPFVYEEPSVLVHPGSDLVMCLSCHVAHASPYDGMLRFDYRKMVAGNAGTAAGTGCFACHTSKARQ
jgi:hypothetical protein